MVSVALFFGLSANSIHKGVYEVSGLLHPFVFYQAMHDTYIVPQFEGA